MSEPSELRYWADWYPTHPNCLLLRAAADEIERLRTELADLKAKLEGRS